ncbi:MAG: hypothetical protein Q8Q49_04000 [bacterium]|nr:hypothetical protein [bacterium]
MADFRFLHNPISRVWVISAPRRARRPNEAEKHLMTCPFCTGGRAETQLVYQIGDDPDWRVRVVYNTFPFAPLHEVVIHSPDHLKSFAELSVENVDTIFQAFQHRYNEYAHRGQVIIFHNHGALAGESLPHPHTQIAVIPERVRIDAPELRSVLPQEEEYRYESESFVLLTPKISQWPDEVWITPKTKGKTYGQITEKERFELSSLVKRLVLIYDHRYNRDFPFNFYIYPGEHWYIRIIPRIKSIGGFELATGIFVNTQRPEETMAFIREHLREPNLEKILKEHQAEYHRTV